MRTGLGHLKLLSKAPEDACTFARMPSGTNRRAVIAMLSLVIIIDLAGIGFLLPILPQILLSITGSTVSDAAILGSWILIGYGCAQFLFAPLIGVLSDQYGRRFLVISLLLALCLNYAFLGFASAVWLFVVGRFLAGIFGGSMVIVYSMACDLFDESDRAKVFGLLSGMAAFGIVLGPVTGAFLAQFGLRVPFFTLSLAILAIAVLAVFFLPETLPKSHRRSLDIRRANPVGALLHLRKYPVLTSTLATLFMLELSAQAYVSTWAFFGLEKFGWSISRTAFFVTIFGVAFALMRVFAAGWLANRFGPRGATLVCLPCAVLAFLAIAFVQEDWLLIPAIALGAMAAPVFPALQTRMTRIVGEDEVGLLQGSVASTISAAATIGPLAMTAIFYVFSDRTGVYFPGMPFVFAACLCAVAWLLMLVQRDG